MGQLSPEQLQNYDFAPLQSPQQMAAATAVIAAAPEYAEQYQGSGGIAQMMQQPEMRQIERVVSATEDEAVAHTNRMNIEGLANDQVDNLEQIRDILKSSGKREGE